MCCMQSALMVSSMDLSHKSAICFLKSSHFMMVRFLKGLTFGIDAFSDFLNSVLEAGFDGRDWQFQNGGNVRKTVVAMDSEADDLGLFVWDGGQQCGDFPEFLLEIIWLFIEKMDGLFQGDKLAGLMLAQTVGTDVGQTPVQVVTRLEQRLAVSVLLPVVQQ